MLIGVLLLTLRIGYTQFHGPQSEVTLSQAVAGRQLAAGEGYTTTIRYPQTLAVLKSRSVKPNFTRAWPELQRPPLYAALIGGVIAATPARYSHVLFQKAPNAPDGFGGDYLLLGLNIVLLWLAAWLTFILGRRLFDATVGLVASLGLLAGVSIWTQTVSLNGTPLMMVLLLALFYLLVRGDSAVTAGKPLRPWFFAAGVFCGLMFLCDYPAGLVVVPVLLFAGLRCTGGVRMAAILGVAIGFILVVYPWMSRNVGQTGHPLALAGYDIALKAGDPTAEPEILRNTLSAAGPVLDLDKLGNKGLTGLKVALRDQVWSGGMLFTALFAVGLLYRFRSATANRMRWVFLAMLVVLVVAQAFLDSGEGERFPAIYAVPLIAIFGAGFFTVLVASNEKLAVHARWVPLVLIGLQALPLLHAVMEPRRLHFSYPPYYPAVFVSMREDSTHRGGQAWMADVPAGAAWYSGQPVWSQPAKLREYYEICMEQPPYALVLTPHTLDRPYFAELARIGSDPGLLGEWAQVYSALITKRFPAGFSLIMPQKVADNLYVLFDPRVLPGAGK